MKINLLMLTLAAATLLSSCSFLAKTLYGMKDPDFENQKTVLRKQHEIFGSGHRPLEFNFESWKVKSLNSIPEMYVFDQQGRYIPYKDTLRPNCNGPAETFASELDPDRTYLYDASMNLSKFLGYVNQPGCGPSVQLPDEAVDFTIMLTWAAYAGKKIYKQKTILWLEELKKNSKIKYRVYLVNKDLQECWPEELKLKFTGSR